MEVTVLGSGTSYGVPMIGCHCAVCRSTDPRNRRYRPSIHVRTAQASVIVDAPPELRLQLIENGIFRADAVLLTHTHADHLLGLDDLRRLNVLSGKEIPILGQASDLEAVRRVFDYAFQVSEDGLERPSFQLCETDGPICINDLPVEPLQVYHGELPVLAYRFGSFAYVTDVSHIPDRSMERLRGLDWLILDAVRYTPHPSHFHLEAALGVLADLKPCRAALTHLSHDYDHESVNRTLPSGVELAYDGMKLQLSDPLPE